MKFALRTGLFEGARASSTARRVLASPRARSLAHNSNAGATVRRVLVTGADGFIGTQIAATLRAHGIDVTGVVFRRAAKEHEVRADLTESADLHTLPTDVDAIVHAAGIVDGAAAARRVFELNVGATRALLGWAKQNGASHFVQVSSVAVYGPLALGTHRTEQTPRLGMHVGLPYMRSKALAEALVEQSALPFTLLRPPAVIGPGDTVLTRSLVRALRSEGIPQLGGRSRASRLVSLCFVEGLANLTYAVLRRGPLNDAVHAVDVELSLTELVAHYASALGVPYRTASIGVGEAFSRRSEAGYAWLVASSLAGQHYSAERLHEVFGYRSALPVHDAVRAAVWGL